MKTLQHFSDEYLEQCRAMSPLQILNFLDNFQKMLASPQARTPQKLISIKMPEDLLREIKKAAQKHGLPYQTYIKEILRRSL